MGKPLVINFLPSPAGRGSRGGGARRRRASSTLAPSTPTPTLPLQGEGDSVMWGCR